MELTNDELYRLGVEACNEFLELNSIERPRYMTYDEALRHDGHDWAIAVLRRTQRLDHPYRTGRTYGLYSFGTVFVNVVLATKPVLRPAMRSWSWPGYKVDRTAMGICAHEVGHHVAQAHVARSTDAVDWTAKWRNLLANRQRKVVSGYEPVPDEAWAETMRLFILNPDLLRKAIPWRYDYVTQVTGLRPIERVLRKGWRKVLSNLAYEPAAERWITGL